MIPATAGAIMTEERLRAYIKCSQFFHYGGMAQASLETRMAQYTLEYYLAAQIRMPHRGKSYILSRALLQAAKRCELDSKYLVGQVLKATTHTTLWMDEFLKTFSEDIYFPVVGPLPWRTVVSKTPIDLQISGVLRTEKNQTLHIIAFSPYKHHHSQINDPITHIKIAALRHFVKGNGNRTQARLHFLWAQKNGGMGYDSVDSKSLNPKYLKLIEQKVKEMERGTCFPVLPCPFKCTFKEKCFPGGIS
jgi:hypothetical protein